MIHKVLLGLVAAVVLLSVAGLCVLVYQGKRKPQGNPEYVALGSSFAAGIGLGARAADSPLVCMRTTNGYPQILARMRGLSLVDVSCSGATARHVLLGGQVFLPPQIDALSTETRLVTMTIGGNDVRYVGDLSFMAARHTTSLLSRALRLFWKGPLSPQQRKFAELGEHFTAILQQVKRRSPHARIVVATYPLILPAGLCPKLGITEPEAAMMRDVGEQLAALTRSVAQANGAVLVDMQTLGVGHDACSADPWVNGWADPHGTQFHPTQAGAQAVAEAINAALGPP